MAKPDPDDFVSAKDDVDAATANAPKILNSRLDGISDSRSGTSPICLLRTLWDGFRLDKGELNAGVVYRTANGLTICRAGFERQSTKANARKTRTVPFWIADLRKHGRS
jgi:hypothetical protein